MPQPENSPLAPQPTAHERLVVQLDALLVHPVALLAVSDDLEREAAQVDGQPERVRGRSARRAANAAAGTAFTATTDSRHSDTHVACPNHAAANLGADFLISSNRDSDPSFRIRWNRPEGDGGAQRDLSLVEGAAAGEHRQQARELGVDAVQGGGGPRAQARQVQGELNNGITCASTSIVQSNLQRSGDAIESGRIQVRQQ
ncbi:hypothetical protein GGR58DRAFT_509095 [Xylaria digitata]|nr:hypothetical protein GGR58DRAFT_509095 [Xylaria digitata]